MCAIAGVLWLTARRPHDGNLTAAVGAALELLRRRGPDESATTLVSDRCLMGGNRLIVRGSLGVGSMPFTSPRCTAYYNGEIYNFSRWSTAAASDGEILIPLYETLGLDMFGSIDGEFALSLWDDERQTLVLARDHFGTKPLYFSLTRDRLLWASSSSAINAMDRHPFCAATKSSVYTSTYSVQEPYTSFAGIWSVPPGHAVIASPEGVALVAYHQWPEAPLNREDPEEVFVALDESLTTRMDYRGRIGIPLSAGVDSGIMAFAANTLGVKFHVFSVVEMFGRKTPEADAILERTRRLGNASDVSLLSCDRADYELALEELFQPDYYDSEKYDGGSICMHTVFAAMKRAGIRVALDGTGGDELFHGYTFRHRFQPVAEWPRPWARTRYFYSVFTSLLDYTAKSDRAGAHFSIECRYPFQSVRLMQAALSMRPGAVRKWPLRAYLLRQPSYGPALPADRSAKYGFSLLNADPDVILHDMRRAWCQANGLSRPPTRAPDPFPFAMGLSANVPQRGRVYDGKGQ